MRDLGRDLAWSVRAWRVDWRLPAAGLAVAGIEACLFAIGAAAGVLGAAAKVAALAWTLFFVGFRGTERVWYDDLGAGRKPSWARLRRLNGDLRRRFFVLGLWVLIPLIVPISLTAHAAASTKIGVNGVALWLVDVLLTFVTVTLSFSTSDVPEAISSGLRLLAEKWPRCAAYALVPPLAIQLVVQLSGGFGVATRLIGGILVAPLVLASRGAVVRYYDRECRVMHAHRPADAM